MIIINKDLFHKVADEMIKHAELLIKDTQVSPEFSYPGFNVKIDFIVNFNKHTKIGTILVKADSKYILITPFKSKEKLKVSPETKELMVSHIAELAFNHLIEKQDFHQKLMSTLESASPIIELPHPFGFSVKYNNDIDGQQFMISGPAPERVTLYALEDAVDMEQSIGSLCLASPKELVNKVKCLEEYYILNDLCPELEGTIGE